MLVLFQLVQLDTVWWGILIFWYHNFSHGNMWLRFRNNFDTMELIFFGNLLRVRVFVCLNADAHVVFLIAVEGSVRAGEA